MTGIFNTDVFRLGPETLMVSSAKLLKRTGFVPRITLEQGMMELYIALKGHRIEPSATTNTEKVYSEMFGTSPERRVPGTRSR